MTKQNHLSNWEEKTAEYHSAVERVNFMSIQLNVIMTNVVILYECDIMC